MVEAKMNQPLMGSELRFLTLSMVAATIPWSIFANNLAIIIFLFAELAMAVWRRENWQIPRQPGTILFIALFLFSALGWFYSDNQSEAGFLIERQLVFMLFPALVPSVRRETIFQLFALFSISFLFLFCWFILEKGIQLSVYEWFTYLPIHYPYFGIYASISTLFWFWVWGQKVQIPFVAPPLSALYFLLFLGCTFICHSRNAQLFLLISMVLLAFFLFGNLRWKSLASFLIIAMAGVLLLFQFPRFSNFWDALVVKQVSWQCSIESLKTWKDWLWGVGPGDSQFELQECYYRHHSWFYDYKYNSHNQYLTFLLSSGILSFSCFIFLIIFHLWQSFQSKNYLHFFIAFSLGQASLTESLFLTNKGIIFYSFWLVLMTKSTPKD